ncbi:NACHT domain-containing NTPase [Actinomadura sp. WMMA1423]|uniref:NACHT domain-containing protein n=1 Tax=Actinomadura sp. WMMA1423 TaxID=2591108 RepID=UPI001146987F|nr:hypothetical protein [Actinomadura sp. WMMA1423]
MGQADDEIAKFRSVLKTLIRDAARTKAGKGPDWEPRNNEIAWILGVNPATITRWFNGASLPRRTAVASFLEMVGSEFGDHEEFLRWWGRVDRLRKGVPVPAVMDGPEQPHPAPQEAPSRPVPLPAEEIRWEGTGVGASVGPLDKAVAALARNLYGQWDSEASYRGLVMPPPIPPRWTRTERPVAGRVSVAVGDPDKPGRFRELPETQRATADTIQEGGLKELFEIYAGLGSGRIILMGHYGSGKTSTAILLLLHELDRRIGLTRDTSRKTPVPLLLTAQDWNFPEQSLSAWFAQQLATTYTFLGSAEYGPDAAWRLVREGRVALFLDAFDELDPERQIEAIHSINRESQTFRLVLLTRTQDFTAAVKAGHRHVHGAVALELRPVTPDLAISYLKDYQPFPAPDDDPLRKVIEQLETDPEHPIGRALDTPFNLALLSADPQVVDELSTAGPIETREKVEDLLLGRVVSVAYGPDQRRITEAKRYLGYLAVQMDGEDLSWWRMHHWVPRWERYVLNTLAGALITSVTGLMVFGPVGQYTVTGHTGTLFGLSYGAAMGSVFGFLATVVSEARDPRPKDPERRSDRRSGARRRVLPGFPDRVPRAVNPAVALLILAVVTMAVRNQSGHLLFGLLAGVVASCASGHAATRVRSISSMRRRWARLGPNLTDLLASSTIGVPIGLAYGLTKSPEFGAVAGLLTGSTFGFMTSMARPTSDTETPPDPETHWKQDRSRTLLVALTAAVPIGLALGIQNGRAHGLVAGITAFVGLSTILGLGTAAGISDIWRTALVFVQLRLRGDFPLRGMRFLRGARKKQVLRTVGAKIQFRHDRVRIALTPTRR